MFFTETDDGIILRVRLTPNAAAAAVKRRLCRRKGNGVFEKSALSAFRRKGVPTAN